MLRSRETNEGGGHFSRPRADARKSKFQMSSGGLNQESRDHNKHNRQTQQGHKPQSHKRAEKKH